MIIDKEQSVWYKRYRPQRIEDSILPVRMKEKLNRDLASNNLVHMGLFSATPGTGKSSLALAIIEELNGEAIVINASLDKGIDLIRSKLMKFVTTDSFDGKQKIILLDEFDAFSKDGQSALRGFIDDFSGHCVFIITGNYKEKILEPILDRLEVYEFEEFSKKEMIPGIFDRLKFVLDTEEIQYEPKDLIPVINTFYPRIRSMIGALQKFSYDGKFTVSESELDNIDAFDSIIKKMLKKDFNNVLQDAKNISAPDNFYIHLFKNLTTHFKDDKRPIITVVIAKYQHMSATVRDKNLNLAACMMEIMLSL